MSSPSSNWFSFNFEIWKKTSILSLQVKKEKNSMKYFVLPTFLNSTSLWLALLIGLRWVERSFSCPPGCLCEPLKVNCTGMNLFSIPTINVTTRMLYVAFNKITSLPQIELSYLSELVHLDCSHNQIVIRFHSEFVFPDLKELTYLDLSYNNISFISPFTFKQLNKLLFLNLSGNRGLTEIHHKTFEHNTMLSHLDISNCDLSYLSANQFVHLHNFHYIGITGNSWHCDCDMLEFSTWLNETNVKFTEGICSKPDKIQGNLIAEVEDILHFDCLVHLGLNDFIFIVLIAFCLFIVGTFAAWLVGISTVIYSRYIAVKMDEDSEDEDQKTTVGHVSV